MNLHEFLRSRRSVRRFGSDTVSSGTIERVLTTATYAPSAHNRQPWRFAVLTTDSVKSRLADAMARDFRRDLEADRLPTAEVDMRVEKSTSRIRSAPVVVILCMDVSEMDSYPDLSRAQAERTMAIQSTANAGLALLFAAHAEGLGSVWSCAPLFATRSVQETLDLPAGWEPQAMFFLGSPVGGPGPKSRKPLSEVAVFK